MPDWYSRSAACVMPIIHWVITALVRGLKGKKAEIFISSCSDSLLVCHGRVESVTIVVLKQKSGRESTESGQSK